MIMIFYKIKIYFYYTKIQKSKKKKMCFFIVLYLLNAYIWIAYGISLDY